MSALSIPQAIAQLMAWHNRHPLAERITPAQVVGLGVVALPFAAKPRKGGHAPTGVEPVMEPSREAQPAATSLRERANASALGTAHAAPTPLVPLPGTASEGTPGRRAFSERFMAQPSLWRIARFARRHGSEVVPNENFGPRRDVAIDDKLSGSQMSVRFLGTAAIETGERRVRVLWALNTPHTILGTRLWSRTRVTVLGAVSASCVMLAAALPLWLRPASEAGAPPMATAASAPVVAAASMAAVAVTHTAVAPVETIVAASVPAPPPPEPEPEPEVAVAELPPPALPGSAVWPVSIRPHIDTGIRRHARADGQSIRATPKPATAKVQATAVAPKPGTAYAVVARSTKSRLASEMLLGFMLSAAASKGKTSQHTEVVPDAKGWRASWWPFASRLEAERARAVLAATGMHTDVVEF